MTTLLDGRATPDELLEEASGRNAANEFREILDWLRRQHLVEVVDPARAPQSVDLGVALRVLGADPDEILPRLAALPILVLGCSPLAERIAAMVRNQGFADVRVASSGDQMLEAGLTVAVETDVSVPELERLNRSALMAWRPWMLVGAWNRRLLIGPIIIPGQTACYVCYRRRLDSHRAHLAARRALEEWQLTHPPPPSPEPLLPALVELTAAHTALELFHFISGVLPSRIVGSVLVYSPVDAGLKVEPVLRIPWCSACNEPCGPVGEH
jgi:bacteriocin biosynthesis cyclodehydratase domain-containing protein